MTRRAGSIAAAALSALLLSSCTSQPTSHGTAPVTDPQVGGALRLVAFDNCTDLLTGLRTAAKASVGPYGFGDDVIPIEGGSIPYNAKGVPKAADAAGSGAIADNGTSTTSSGADNPYSGTNVQEAGVDEPDLVKTDGKRIVTVSGGVLRVTDAASRKVTGSVRLPGDPTYGLDELLLAGDRALVFGQHYQTKAEDDGMFGPSFTLVDLSGAPKVLSQYTMDGYYVDARQIGHTARVVVRTGPRLKFDMSLRTKPGYDNQTETERTAANQKVIDNAPIGDWLPRYSVVDGAGKATSGTVDCGAVSRPEQYSGSTMLTVLTFDMGATKLSNGDPTTIVADGQTVYSTGSSLYIASDQRWWFNRFEGGVAQPGSADTRLYKFDISGTARPKYVAGGQIDGYLLNQYSLSELDGKLQVATTTGQPGRVGGTAPSSPATSQSTVYVLAQDGTKLNVLGKVGDLGRGEKIYAVRFIGTTAYVVTFRQTDPLYTVDLSNPAAPRVTGELKINGFSAYLHPAGDGKLIGIGQDASSTGRVQGLQVSLFDVHNPAAPTRLAQVTLPNTQSEAQNDPHAFLYWEPTGLLAVPFQSYADTIASGVEVMTVRGTTVTDVGPVTHPNTATVGSGDAQPVTPVHRSLIIGNTLWTASDRGLLATDPTALKNSTWVAF
jgi:hypothetical protein